MLTERINRSMDLLDKLDPNWLSKVNLEALDMADPAFCVAGQTVGFSTVVAYVQVEGVLDDVNELYAFAASWGCDYGTLDAAWRAVIRGRRNEAN